MAASTPYISKKVVGTAVPIFALWSRENGFENASGTVATAFRFLNWLRETGQHAWQLLPLSQGHLEPGSATVHVPSPYKGYGIGLDPRYLAGPWSSLEPSEAQLTAFRTKESGWIEDYALFCAIRDAEGTDDWRDWPAGLRDYDEEALKEWRATREGAVLGHILTQWRLHEAFMGLREAANAWDIELIGDLPFYAPLQSPLVWANQRCFEIGKDAELLRVSGVPDGPKAHFGRQVWGHPLYAWRKWGAKKRILALWEMRISYFARFYDTMRLDHAKGLFFYGAMDLARPEKDVIEKGPGDPVLHHLIVFGRKVGLELFAEDAGDRLLELRKTLTALKVPGIRILRFAYNEKRRSIETDYSDVGNYPPHTYAYTSTHDTITLMAYVRILTPEEQRHVAEHVGVEHSDDEMLFATRLLEAVIHSPASHAIIPMQDWLLSEERINVPGTEKAFNDPNWRYRLPVPIEDLPGLGVR